MLFSVWRESIYLCLFPSDSRADATEEHCEASDGVQIFMDAHDSEIRPDPEISQSQEEKEPDMLDFPQTTFADEESTDSGSEEQTREWTETEANGELSDARADVQDQIQGPDECLEKEESSSPEIQSDRSQDDIITGPTEPPDLTDDSVQLEELILTQEPENISTSVTVAEMNQNNGTLEIQGVDLSEESNAQEQVERPVSSEQKSDPENEPPEQAEQSECFRCPDEKGSSEQIQCSDEEKPCDQTPPSECSDASSDTKQPADTEEHVRDETSEPVIDTEPAGPCINGSAKLVNRAEAQRLAEKLYRLDGFQRTDVVRHLDKE